MEKAPAATILAIRGRDSSDTTPWEAALTAAWAVGRIGGPGPSRLPRLAPARFLQIKDTPVAGIERNRELRRRRARREKITKLKARLAKSTTSEKGEIARKLREMTPGAEQLIVDWKLNEVDR